MRLGIIGAGKAGVSLGKYLSSCEDITLTGFFSRTVKSAEEGAQFTETKVFATIEDMIPENDMILIATPDGEIAKVWEKLKKLLPVTKEIIIGHLSGVLSSELFHDSEKPDIHGISIHPVYAFNDRFTCWERLNTAFFTLEGDEKAVALWKTILSGMGNKTAAVDASSKVRYHAACAMASNDVLGLIKVCIDELKRSGFAEEEAYTLLEHLVKNNVDNAFKVGVEKALTGPVERNDVGTVKKHLSVMGENETLYRELGKAVLDIAMGKHKDTDYSELRGLFNGIN